MRRLVKISINTGPHLTVFLRICSRTAIFLTDGGIDSAKAAPSQGLYRRAVMTPHFANSSEVLAARISSMNMPVEPKTKSAESASPGPEYSKGR